METFTQTGSLVADVIGGVLNTIAPGGGQTTPCGINTVEEMLEPNYRDVQQTYDRYRRAGWKV